MITVMINRVRDFISPALLKKVEAYVMPAIIVLLVFAIPFNIVYHFNSDFAYIDGYLVNYLDCVLHIVDICMILLCIWLLAV